jgi:biopolymer transport protein ExbD
MADVNLTTGKSKRSLRVDLTPMVDLGFILISFFLYTTTLTAARVKGLSMPDKPHGDSTEAATDATLTVYPDEKSVHYEEGKPGSNPMREVYLDKTPSLREAIIDKQRRLDHNGRFTRDSLVVIIKPRPGLEYRQLIGVLDEMIINGVTKYMIADQDSTGGAKVVL